ncbi:kinesin-like protein KIN-7K, chloroplastic isoform X1 [Aristolochia californica]|uniref:kinesin-like protein KIN-7K, chloroplastic isoform X1 n=2 Tax=Aristolochia californica TaxID=171875 RepID=UPI0035D80694
MAMRITPKSKKSSSPGSKPLNSPSSSNTSSSRSRQFPEVSFDIPNSPASSSTKSRPQYFPFDNVSLDSERFKENVTVTVRFRPLSPREIRQGDEVAWYADGDTIVRNEHNTSIAYAYDRVFGPTTTTRHVYDVAAQHVISGAMEGINGTIFAYGVTSSGKTHTMHGDQRSPGIIPLAVKDAFSIIQETPSREFLLRVSYLEIYNEVVNDLLNPTGQNLRIREDNQGTFVEGIKEEIVLSPAHALSLIAAGEAQRHVGSNNFNLMSSRSHTIFTLTIESSPCGENSEGEAVSLSQLNLIDLAGSESSKAETTGVRRKEGSYINKSLLTLGMVISKLTDGKAAHIPYRDSKLTRLLQSSLSGHGRVSLICTVTPSSSNSEETHNTLKFAHRAKHIEIQASQNKIIDEKSLIKKYQHEIRKLKEELEQLKKGIVAIPPRKDVGEDDIYLLRQKLEDGQFKLQSRLEEEEEAKAVLLERIQRLTKLILVSTKASQSSRFHQRPISRRRHSFGEEELAYLPYRRRDLILVEENIDESTPESGGGSLDDGNKDEKKNRKQGLLNWFKLRKRENESSDGDASSRPKSVTSPSTPRAEGLTCHTDIIISNSLNTESDPSTDLLLEMVHDRDVQESNFCGQETPSTSLRTVDHIDLLKEQIKILFGEVALQSSALKRLSEEATSNPRKEQIQMEIAKLNDEIKVKNQQIASLEKQMTASIQAAENKVDGMESYSELLEQLNQKSFELEVKAADNRIIQEQLQQKIYECEKMKETVASLKEQLSEALEFRHSNLVKRSDYQINLSNDKGHKGTGDVAKDMTLRLQATEVQEFKQKISELTEEKLQLEARSQKLAEESSYAKGLASAAAVELKALSEEVAKLIGKNEALTAELAAVRNSNQRKAGGGLRNGRREVPTKRPNQVASVADMKRELGLSRERELSYEAALVEKEQKEAELQKKVEESKHREAYLENELANMWVLVAQLKKSNGAEFDKTELMKGAVGGE